MGKIEEAAKTHWEKNNCPECCGRSYDSFMAGATFAIEDIFKRVEALYIEKPKEPHEDGSNWICGEMFRLLRKMKVGAGDS